MGITKNKRKWILSLRLPPNRHGIRRFRRSYSSRAVAKLVYHKLKAAIALGALDELSLFDPTQPEKPKPFWPRKPRPSGESVPELTAVALKYALPSDKRFSPNVIPSFLNEFSVFLNEHPPMFLKSGIYFLMQGDDVVYVGQSNSLAFRIALHGQQKQFDRALFISVDKQRLDFMEAYFIKKLNPSMNRVFPVAALGISEIDLERPISGHDDEGGKL